MLRLGVFRGANNGIAVDYRSTGGNDDDIGFTISRAGFAILGKRRPATVFCLFLVADTEFCRIRYV